MDFNWFSNLCSKRPGLHGKIFTMFKFKTLYDDPKNILSEEKRQSKFGNFLRKTGLDELPQLFNVLGNSMSIVGPRPLLIEYLKQYSKYENLRHQAKPGITGLAQVTPDPSGKKIWKKSIELDVMYTTKIKFLMDVKIIYKTLILILSNKKQSLDFKKFYE